MRGDGETDVLTTPDAARGEQSHSWPTLLPNGSVLFTGWTGDPATSTIDVFDPVTKVRTTVLKGGVSGAYVSTGHLLYASGSALHAVRFDLERLAVVGAAVPVVERVFTSASGAAAYAVGSDGSLVYLPTDRLADEQWSMMWVDRSGEAQAIPAPNHRYFMPRISPDGTRIAIDVRDPAGSDIWIWHFDRQVLTRFFPHRHHR